MKLLVLKTRTRRIQASNWVSRQWLVKIQVITTQPISLWCPIQNMESYRKFVVPQRNLNLWGRYRCNLSFQQDFHGLMCGVISLFNFASHMYLINSLSPPFYSSSECSTNNNLLKLRMNILCLRIGDAREVIQQTSKKTAIKLQINNQPKTLQDNVMIAAVIRVARSSQHECEMLFVCFKDICAATSQIVSRNCYTCRFSRLF